MSKPIDPKKQKGGVAGRGNSALIARKSSKDPELQARIDAVVAKAASDNMIDVIRDATPFHWRQRIRVRKLG